MSLSAPDLAIFDAPTMDIARWLVHERSFSVIALDHAAADLDLVIQLDLDDWLAGHSVTTRKCAR